MKPEFPEFIDSTMLAAFKSCPQKMWWQYGEGWEGQGESVDLLAGKSFARGVEMARRAFWEEGKDKKYCLGLGMEAAAKEYGDFVPAPNKMNKSKERVLEGLKYYFENFKLEDSKVLMVEGKALVEVGMWRETEVEHPEGKGKIKYCGTPDSVEEYAGGVWVADEKTTGKGFGAGWGRKWALRGQFTGYVWLAQGQEWGRECKGALVRGLAFLPKNYDVAFEASGRAGYQMEEWKEQMEKDLKRMVKMWEEGVWDKNFGDSCEGMTGWASGACQFLQVCESKDKETWLEINFKKAKWDPVTRTREEGK